ncbi:MULTISPECIES: PqqD family peptide modification chaperone [Anaerolinea]|uniref:radical SAM protein n=1 Tax=Anaerolinea TaxID=233189 RepID=UPI00261023B0|nr:PqqD family peptide modification chaperone [Anaerolinea thermophila]
MNFPEIFNRFFPAYQPIPAGNYSGTLRLQSSIPNKVHLRVEKNGTGIMILNGSIVLHLNQTATELTYHLLENRTDDQIIKTIQKRYGISREQAAADLNAFTGQLENLLNLPDVDPVAYLGIERVEVNTGAMSAPYRLDCALTYRHPDLSYLRSAPVERVKTDLRAEEWKTILKKAWDAGIPHVIFTGGEPLLREECPELILYASKLGMVTGLLSTGYSLTEQTAQHLINDCGLDHIMIIFQEGDQEIWEKLDILIRQDISIAVHITITHQKRHEYIDLFEHLQQKGIRNLSLSTNSLDFRDEVFWARDKIAEMGISLIWDIPVPYSRLHPVALEIALSEENKETITGYSSLYVEPDGDVLLSQGEFQVLGNFLKDSWETIWNAAIERRKIVNRIS